MKKIIKYSKSLFFILSFLVVACQDFLDKEPLTSIVTETFFETPEDAFEALISCYDAIQPGWYNSPKLVIENASDNCFAGGSAGSPWHRIDQLSAIQTNETGFTNQWNDNYQGVFRVNNLLENIDQIDFGSQTELKERYIAEAKFIRAYCYLNLVRLFENIPLITKVLDPDEWNQKQSSPDDVYSLIFSDISDAIKDLSNTPYSSIPSAEKGRVTKWAAEALGVRAYLFYSGVYNQTSIDDINKDKAINWVDDIITNSGHDLVPNFGDLWYISDNFVGENNVESIFEIQYNDQTQETWDQLGDASKEGNSSVVTWGLRGISNHLIYDSGYGFLPVNSKLWNAFDENDSVRRNMSIISVERENLTTTQKFQDTEFFIKKWTPLKEYKALGGNREINYPYNMVMIRFSDVLLMGAELHLDNNISLAQNYYSRVYTRARGNTVTVPALTNDEHGMDLIFEERHLELAFEEVRYWDLMRRGLDYLANAVNNEDHTGEFAVTFKPETRGFFPIPEQELLLSNGDLIQNGGY